MCGRPPGTLSTYRRITGARSSPGTSTSLTARARRRRRVARPPATRTFRTQLHSPSIETMYHWPSTSAMPRGNRVTVPVRRPRTSSVTQRRGRRPRRNAMFQNHAYRRAVALPRPPTYIARSLSYCRPFTFNLSHVGALSPQASHGLGAGPQTRLGGASVGDRHATQTRVVRGSERPVHVSPAQVRRRSGVAHVKDPSRGTRGPGRLDRSHAGQHRRPTPGPATGECRSEEHTSELQSRQYL